ncbi:hypothetical protein [Capnocytophaga gingivalis]|jgi:hypothetical protein
MKILIIFILYFAIPHYLFSQEGQLENPYYNIKIINQSILYFKNILDQTNSYDERKDFLLITEKGQIIENKYFGEDVYNEIKDFFPLKGERGILEEENIKKIFNKLDIKNGSLYIWKVYVFYLFNDHICIIFRRHFLYHNNEGIFLSPSETEALFLYKYDNEKKEFCLDKTIFDSSIPKTCLNFFEELGDKP